MNTRTPEELIALAQQGDQAAYGCFLEMMNKQIMGDVRRGISGQEDQEEMSQMALMKIHQYLASYSGQGSVRGWVRTITRNVIFDFYKSKDKKSFIGLLDEWSDEVISGESEDNPETLAAFNEAFENMSEKEIAPALKSKLENTKLEELAKEEGISVANYKVKVHRAKKAFIKYLSAIALILMDQWKL